MHEMEKYIAIKMNKLQLYSWVLIYLTDLIFIERNPDIK